VIGTIRLSALSAISALREAPATIAEPSRFLLGELRKFGHKAFVIGDFIKPGKDILACRSVPAWLLPNDVINQKCAADASVAASEISYNRRLAQLLTSDFIDIFDVQCPQGACIYVKDGTPLFRDSHHLTARGAIFFLGRMKASLPIGDSTSIVALPPSTRD
jgi:hypothetical protein